MEKDKTDEAIKVGVKDETKNQTIKIREEQAKNYTDLAKETKDSSYCASISSSEMRGTCYMDLAVILNDSQLCKKIEAPSLASSCIKDFGSFIATAVRPLDLAESINKQKTADEGQDLWLISPVEVARTEGIEFYGFTSDDRFTLLSKEFAEYAGTYTARVEATHEGLYGEQLYIIQLIQPEKTGEEGIWQINSIQRK